MMKNKAPNIPPENNSHTPGHSEYSVLESLPAASIICGERYQILFVSVYAAQILESTPAKLKGKLFTSLLAESSGKQFSGHLGNLDRGDSIASFELELAASHRETLFLHVRANRWGVDQYCIILNDITGSRIATETLARSAHKYRRLVETIPAITYITSTDKAGHVIYASPQVSEILGYSQDEFAELFEGFRKSIVHPDERAEVLAKLKQCIETGEPYIGEYRMMTRSGEYRWFHDEGVLVSDEHGSPLMQQGVLFDITLRVESEKRFEIQHAQLEALIESLREAVAITDNTGVIRRINAEFERLFGYSAEEVAGKNIIGMLTPPEKQHEAYRYFEQVRQGNTINTETIRMKKDGSRFDVSLLGAPIIMRDNDIGVYIIYRDITERKRAEEEIRKQYSFLWNILNSLPYPFYIIRVADREVLMMNSHAEYLCGKNNTRGSCRQVIQSGKRICSEDYPCPLDIVVQTKRPVVIEHVISDNPKNPIFHEIHAYPIFDEKGNIVEMIEYTLDITGRKESESERKKLTTAIEQTSNVVMMTDLKGNIEFVNRAFEEVTGYSKKEALGKNPHLLRTNLLPKEYYQRLWQTISSGQVWYGEFLNKKKDGSTYWAEASISPIKDEHDKIVNYIGIQEDITEKKKADTELYRAKEAAEVANRMKSEFLANVSHEIRTPLNSILGFAQILLDETHEAKTRELLEIIERSGRNLLYIISDILDFSKIEAGKIIVESVPFSLNEVLQDIRNMFSLKAKEIGLNFEIRVDKNVPDFVIGDHTKIRQVIVNLVSNALKFTKKGSVIIDINYYYGTALIKVSDTGIGIPKEKLKNIFSPFEQADASHSREYGGTGLGLTITKKLTEIMGGKVSVESQPGKGSTFSVTIPILPTAAGAPESEMRDLPVFPSDKDEYMVLGWLDKMNGDPDLEHIFFEGLRKLPEKVKRLEDAIIHEDAHEMKFHAHDLKGVSGNFGMMEIYEIAKEIDRIISEESFNIDTIREQSANLTEIIDRIPDHYLHIKQVFQKPLPSGKTPGTVLIVDDNELNRKLIHTLLAKMGIMSVAVENGKSAIDKIKSERFSLVIMDIFMPDMNGFDTLKKIRDMKNGKELIAVALTANTGKDVIERALSSGFNEFLSKPIDRILFEKKIGRISKQFLKEAEPAENVLIPEVRPELNSHQQSELSRITLALKENCMIFNSREVSGLADALQKEIPFPYYYKIAERIRSASRDFDDELLLGIVKELENENG
jgi:PAS domain S-box-containing protein